MSLIGWKITEVDIQLNMHTQMKKEKIKKCSWWHIRSKKNSWHFKIWNSNKSVDVGECALH